MTDSWGTLRGKLGYVMHDKLLRLTQEYKETHPNHHPDYDQFTHLRGLIDQNYEQVFGPSWEKKPK